MLLIRLLLITLFVYFGAARKGFGPTDQEWGFAPIRKSGSMFWWLHYTTAPVTKYTDRPLIIWLQGGPGASSSGYGNFAELGPLDLDLKPRNTTWVQWANVLFVDNPVGVGFGEADDDGDYATDNKVIGQDFVVLLKNFYAALPEFKEVPLYIFCESYGGKMTADIAWAIHEANLKGDVKVNLKGIGLGDSWVSPIDSVLSWAPYLLALGQLDNEGYDRIMKAANECKEAIEEGNLSAAFGLWSQIEGLVGTLAHVDFYNVLTKQYGFDTKMKNVAPWKRVYKVGEGDLDYIMNEQVAPALNITAKWNNMPDDVLEKLTSDFMNPVTEVVEKILNETDIKVAVYNGQLDLIVSTLGTLNWVDDLNFDGKDLWDAAPRNGFSVNGYYEGYVKRYGNFAFYWVDRSGHMVPADNPAAMQYILKDVTDNFKV